MTKSTTAESSYLVVISNPRSRLNAILKQPYPRPERERDIFYRWSSVREIADEATAAIGNEQTTVEGK
jgi:hypothetical protein